MKKISLKNNSACLITDRLTRKYLTGIDIAEGVLVLGESTAYFTDARYFYSAKFEIERVGIKAVLFSGNQQVFDFLKSHGVENLYIDYSRVTIKEYNEYSKYGIKLFDLSETLSKMRSVKDDNEIEKIERACQIAQTAYYFGIGRVKEGIREIELKNIIEESILSQGSFGPSFDIIVAFGENSAVPHHQTGHKKLEKDMPILVDMGAMVDGYMSDLTRTAFFGNPSEKFISCYEKVLNANNLAEEEILSGITSKDADKIARDYLDKEGLGEKFTHSLGHGVGLEIHEYPNLSKRGEGTIEENMVFTIEPGVYFDGEFGIRIEDTVVIKNGKVKRLFSDDKSLLIIK